jgi:membrane protease YdiL (CAAX protease family)
VVTPHAVIPRLLVRSNHQHARTFFAHFLRRPGGPSPPPPIRPARHGLLPVLAWTLLPVAAFAGLIEVAAEPLTRLAGHLPLAEPFTDLLAPLAAELLLGIAILRLITATIGLERAGFGRSWPSPTVRHRSSWWIRAPLTVILLLLGAAALAYVAGPSPATLHPKLAHISMGALLGLPAATIAVSVFTEELLFRGYVLGRLTAAWGTSKRGVYLAAAVSSVVLGAGHLGHDGPTWELPTTVGGATPPLLEAWTLAVKPI